MAKFVWHEDGKESTTPSTRATNLELLRILCTLFIIAHHFGVHSSFSDVSGFNAFVITAFKSFGQLAVNIYVLISGYFIVNSKFKLKKLLNVIGLTIFYSVSIYIIVSICTHSQIELVPLLKSFLPIRYSAYWFVTCYVAMLLLSPFINKLINALTQIQLILLIVLLVLMQAYVPTVNSYFSFSETAWFITLYLIGAYLKLYPNKITDSKLIMGITCTVFCTIVMLWDKATNSKDLFCLVASVSLFCLFKSLPLGTIKPINFIAKTTFGVYVIHDSRRIRPLLWDTILKAPQHAAYDSFLFYAMACVLIVFVACMLIEFIRIVITSLIVKGFKKIHIKRLRQSE